MNLTNADIRAIVGHYGKDHIIDGFVKALNEVGADYGINNYLRLCHFVAQCATESDYFKTTREYASGRDYEGRRDLGNIHKGDGVRYRGRGVIQLTGRANYTRFGQLLGLDLVENPDQAEDPYLGTVIALQYWSDRGINRFADADNVRMVTKRVNGGLNGFSVRKKFLAKAKSVLRHVRFDVTNEGGGDVPSFPIKRGDRGKFVAELQTKLKSYGYELAVDGAFGPGTERVVREFQRDMELEETGFIDETVWQIFQIDINEE